MNNINNNYSYDVKSLLSKKQHEELLKNVYKNKLTVHYKGELKREGKGFMFNMAYKLTEYRGIRVLSVIISDRCIVVLNDGKNLHRIKRLFANDKIWEVESSVVSIDEQLDLIKKHELLFDKRGRNWTSRVQNKETTVLQQDSKKDDVLSDLKNDNVPH